MNRNRKHLHAAAGFTLIELLTVVAIIAVLIGILVPSLTAARNQARKAATSGFIAGIGKAAEMFFNDNNRYPVSHGLDQPSPFQTNKPVWGAQWIALQLSGPDLQGYVKPVLNNDTNDDGMIDEQDWNEWYSLEPQKNGQPFDYPRLGPYISPDGKSVSTIRRLVQNGVIAEDPNPDAFDGCTAPQSGDTWVGCDLPVYLDSFGRPILYYAANPNARAPFTFGTTGQMLVGRYDPFDNAGFTGNEEPHGLYADRFGPFPDGLRFADQAPPPPGEPLHPLARLGWDAQAATDPPEPTSFADFFADRNIFESTRRGNRGKVWPHNADTFILISAGKDGRYGTTDDIANFQRAGG